MGPNLQKGFQGENQNAFHFKALQSIWLDPTNEQEVLTVINSLEDKTPSGIDDISNIIVKASKFCTQF